MLHIYLDCDIYKLCDPSRLQTIIHDTLNCHWLSLQCWQKSFYKHVQHREDLSKHISIKVSSHNTGLYTDTWLNVAIITINTGSTKVLAAVYWAITLPSVSRPRLTGNWSQTREACFGVACIRDAGGD